jgi:hypothetical protein
LFDDKHTDEPKYGEQVASWYTVWERLYPNLREFHDDYEAIEMQRLRGLVIAQATEVEDILRTLIKHLDPDGNTPRQMRPALEKLEKLLRKMWRNRWERQMAIASKAILARNRAAHSAIVIGSTRVEHADGSPGHHEAVISFMGNEEYDEADLRRDLALQQDATEAIVHIFQAILERESPSSD